jgi:hypothetical protein
MLTTIFAAGVGAFIAHFAAEYAKAVGRKSQSAEQIRDEDLDEILVTTRELQELAVAFWGKGCADLGQDAFDIKAKIVARQHHVLTVVARLFSEASKRDCDASFTYLMDAVSGDNFDDPDRPPSPERFSTIYLNTLNFCHTVKVSRRKIPRGWFA